MNIPGMLNPITTVEDPPDPPKPDRGPATKKDLDLKEITPIGPVNFPPYEVPRGSETARECERHRMWPIYNMAKHTAVVPYERNLHQATGRTGFASELNLYIMDITYRLQSLVTNGKCQARKQRWRTMVQTVARPKSLPLCGTTRLA
jgi:hypothetical protein